MVEATHPSGVGVKTNVSQGQQLAILGAIAAGGYYLIKKIQQPLDDLKEGLTDLGNAALDGVEDGLNTVEEGVEDAKDFIEEKAGDLKDGANDFLDDLKNAEIIDTKTVNDQQVDFAQENLPKVLEFSGTIAYNMGAATVYPSRENVNKLKANMNTLKESASSFLSQMSSILGQLTGQDRYRREQQLRYEYNQRMAAYNRARIQYERAQQEYYDQLNRHQQEMARINNARNIQNEIAEIEKDGITLDEKTEVLNKYHSLRSYLRDSDDIQAVNARIDQISNFDYGEV